MLLGLTAGSHQQGQRREKERGQQWQMLARAQAQLGVIRYELLEGRWEEAPIFPMPLGTELGKPHTEQRGFETHFGESVVREQAPPEERGWGTAPQEE